MKIDDTGNHIVEESKFTRRRFDRKKSSVTEITLKRVSLILITNSCWFGVEYTYRLRQNNVDHGLGMSHANGMSRFKLAFFYGEDAPSNNLRHISASIDGDNKDPGRDWIQMDIVYPGGTIKNHHGLYYQRGSTEEFKVTQ